MSLAPGAQLGPYTITAELGRGGMGVVYTAQDPRLKRQVAIKLLPPDLTRDETAKQRFLQEAQAASALDHPNICTIYEINETADGQLYLVMTYYDGETLKAQIERGPLALDEAVDVATQVGHGLAKAHAAGIVHRDIKPANLMVIADGTVKILDFGLAKLAGAEGVTQTGTTVGTVAYMSPEQARGEEVDHRTDIWSLGVVLYEMLSGQPPFQGDNLLAISSAIQGSQPATLTGPSSLVNHVVDRALEKNQMTRFHAVAALVDALRAARRQTAESSRASELPSIAVLPFANMSGDPEQEYFSDGIAEDLITDLSKISGLFVIARNTAFSFKGQRYDVGQIGHQLGVAHVLEGSVRKAGNRVRINAQLIDTSTGGHVWADRYDGSLEDIFALQDEITEKIVSELQVQLTVQERARPRHRVTDNVQAYETYLRGRAELYRYDPEGTLEGMRLLRRAIELDPSFATAYATLSGALQPWLDIRLS